MTIIKAQTLSSGEFNAYGDIIDTSGEFKSINQGRCNRYHDLAALDISDGRAGISIFKSEHASFPIKVEMMERHPKGSQAFIAMSLDRFLVVVANDDCGKPVAPRAYLTTPGQAVNIHRNVWHGVLTPLAAPGLFAVVDRIGEGSNLEEHWLDTPFSIELM